MTPNDPHEPHLFDKIPGDWFDHAACKGHDHAACKGHDPRYWFPPPRSGPHLPREGKRICREECPVQDECLEFALQTPAETFGIWGGLSTKERRRTGAPGRPTATKQHREKDDQC